jgi:hypothetical protein
VGHRTGLDVAESRKILPSVISALKSRQCTLVLCSHNSIGVPILRKPYHVNTVDIRALLLSAYRNGFSRVIFIDFYCVTFLLHLNH